MQMFGGEWECILAQDIGSSGPTLTVQRKICLKSPYSWRLPVIVIFIFLNRGLVNYGFNVDGIGLA
jgi:hypothetical protein